MTDIDALISAVEAGEAVDLDRDLVCAVMRATGADWWGKAYYADRAYLGSLDAAQRLHDALLPGWAWGLIDDGEAEVWPPTGGFDDPAILGVCRDNPARGWLLAILRAVKG